ncbi:FSH1-domain-containing protein [Melanogaster broomeanus]|nr:FSH1-domain-containing protein [Melanogaster broomeanus]
MVAYSSGHCERRWQRISNWVPIINSEVTIAPIVLQPVDLDGFTANALGADEVTTATSDPTLTPRAWWKANPDRTVASGLEDSLEMLRDILRRDQYDGVFGFSQGAAMAAFLAALLEKPHLYPAFLVDGQPPHPLFQFCVSVSGFKTDVVVVEERSKMLLDVSANARLEEHEGGHFVPSKASWRNFLRDYLSNPLADVPSPGSGMSHSSSGTTTPSSQAAEMGGCIEVR